MTRLVFVLIIHTGIHRGYVVGALVNYVLCIMYVCVVC